MFPAADRSIRVRRVALPGGLALRVADAGELTAPPVLLLHGWGASIYMWRSWFRPLADAGWRPVAIDLPGHGLSDKPLARGTYRLTRQMEILASLIDAESLRGAPVVAQSMAGTLALELMLAQPALLGPLTLINPACFGHVGLVSLLRLVSPPLVDVVLDRLVPRWVVARAHRLAYADPRRIKARDIDEYWAASQFRGYAPAMRRLLHEFAWQRQPADLMAARLRALARPVLVVLGGRDALVRDAGPYVATMRAEQAPLWVLELPDAGHAANEEEPERLVRPVIDFMRQAS